MREVLVFAECYANKFFAEEVKEKLEEAGFSYRLKTVHKLVYGRDRILCKARRVLEERKNTLMLLFIDYEEGPLRRYVEDFFPNRENVAGFSSVYVGRSRFAENLVAVIFDPNIESALGVKADRDRRILKTKHACRKLRSILASRSRLVEEVASKIVSLIGGQSTSSRHPRT